MTDKSSHDGRGSQSQGQSPPPLSSISTAHRTQVRKNAIHDSQVQRLRALIADGTVLDAVDLVRLDDGTLVMADGHHRLQAYKEEGFTHFPMPPNIYEGDIATAISIGLRRNGSHGMPLSPEEKRAQIRRIFSLCPGKRHKDIAEECHVSVSTVGRVWRDMHRELGEPAHADDIKPSEPKGQIDFTGAMLPSFASDGQGSQSQGSNALEPFLAAAERVMGSVGGKALAEDNDETRAEAFKAKTIFAEPKDDSNGAVDACLSAIKEAIASGSCAQAVVLVPGRWWEDWWEGHELWDVALCFARQSAPARRRSSVHDSDNGGSAGAGDALGCGRVVCYFGPRHESFAREFEYDAIKRPLGCGQMALPFRGGVHAIRPQHRSLCSECGTPCSSGVWCPACKQKLRADRAWRLPLMAEIKKLKAEGQSLLQRTTSIGRGVGRVEVWSFLLTVDEAFVTAEEKKALRKLIAARKGGVRVYD